MEEIQLSETEQRYFGDLFSCCDSEKTGKVPVYKASELFRSANLPLDVMKQIADATGGWRGGCVGRRQFFAALKLIAAYQAGLPLRTDVSAPLPRLGWPTSAAAPSPSPATVPATVPAAANVNTVGVWEQPQSRTVGSPDLIQLSDTDPTPTPPQGEPLGSDVEAGGGGERNGRCSAASSSVSSSPSPPPAQPLSLGGAVGATTAAGPEAVSEAPVAAPASAPVPSTPASPAAPTLPASASIAAASSGSLPLPLAAPREAGGAGPPRSPEASSTASDSPTPTNSVQERRWAAQQRWHTGGLVCEEQRQLLGTEEESSDRHSSEEEEEDAEDDEAAAAAAAAAQVWSISPEQRDYYEAQFRSLQPDPQGLVAGPIARLFFEKSRLPVHELRRIWQLSDVTKDGALSLPEFNTAMHLVVLRRNHIALPEVLPPTLVPHAVPHSHPQTHPTAQHRACKVGPQPPWYHGRSLRHRHPLGPSAPMPAPHHWI